MNLKALKKIDPYIVSIQEHSSQVALYKFQSKNGEWEKTEMEGTLFVYKREAEPQYGFTIMNRLSMENLVEPVTKELDFQLQAPFLLYRNHVGDIFGIWFYEQAVCERVGLKIEQLVKEAEMNNVNKQKNGKGDLKSLFGKATGKEKTPEENKPDTTGQNLLQLLTGSKEPVKEPIPAKDKSAEEPESKPEDKKTSASVLDFFAKAEGNQGNPQMIPGSSSAFTSVPSLPMMVAPSGDQQPVMFDPAGHPMGPRAVFTTQAVTAMPIAQGLAMGAVPVGGGLPGFPGQPVPMGSGLPGFPTQPVSVESGMPGFLSQPVPVGSGLPGFLSQPVPLGSSLPGYPPHSVAGLDSLPTPQPVPAPAPSVNPLLQRLMSQAGAGAANEPVSDLQRLMSQLPPSALPSGQEPVSDLQRLMSHLPPGGQEPVSDPALLPVFQRLMSNPGALSVDQLERQQRSSVSPVNEIAAAKNGPKMATDLESDLKSKLNIGFAKAKGGKQKQQPQPDTSKAQISVRSVEEVNSILPHSYAPVPLPTPAPAFAPGPTHTLMSPQVFSTRSTLSPSPSRLTNGSSQKVTVTPLNRAQMLQAVQHLLDNDDEFVTKLHEAYVRSLNSKFEHF